MSRERRKHSPAFRPRCTGGNEGRADGGRVGRPVRGPPQPDSDLEEGPGRWRAAIFDQGNGTNKGKEQKNKNNDALVARLYQQIGQLKVERDFLRKVRSMTPAQRRELTDRQHRHLSIVRQCQLMGVNRSSLYYRPKGTPPGDLSLMQAMDRQYLETPFYGFQADEGIAGAAGLPASRKRVQRLMRLMGLRAIYRQPRTSQPTRNAGSIPTC